MPAPRRSRLTPDELRRLLDYNRLTGAFTWRVDRGRTAKAGDPAGVRQPNGAVLITIKGRAYMANRLAWLYIRGEWPDGRLTTKDLNPGNLKWSNIVEEADFLSTSDHARYQRHRRALRRQLLATGEIDPDEKRF